MVYGPVPPRTPGFNTIISCKVSYRIVISCPIASPMHAALPCGERVPLHASISNPPPPPTHTHSCKGSRNKARVPIASVHNHTDRHTHGTYQSFVPDRLAMNASLPREERVPGAIARIHLQPPLRPTHPHATISDPRPRPRIIPPRPPPTPARYHYGVPMASRRGPRARTLCPLHQAVSVRVMRAPREVRALEAGAWRRVPRHG